MSEHVHQRSSWLPVVAVTLCVVAFCAGQPRLGVAAPATCDLQSASVANVYRKPATDAKPKDSEAITTVELGDVIWVEVTGLTGVTACEASSKNVILFIDDMPMKGLARLPRGADVLQFALDLNPASSDVKVVAETRDAWRRVLASPNFTRSVPVSIGFADGTRVQSSKPLTLRVIPIGWLVGWGVLFVLLLLAFFALAVKTNILRDGQADPAALDWRPMYSLSRTQAALWLFVVLAAYLFIGLITGDFTHSLNATALGLIAIGAGTTAGAAAIDATKATKIAAEEQKGALQSAQASVDSLKSELSTAKGSANKAAEGGPRAEALKDVEAVQLRLDVAESNRLKLLNQSESFFKDIVSDANGVSFHRFQMVAWTIVLAIIFGKETFRTLAMPDFDATLLGLMGLSAATYLGLKTTEATVPKK